MRCLNSLFQESVPFWPLIATMKKFQIWLQFFTEAEISFRNFVKYLQHVCYPTYFKLQPSWIYQSGVVVSIPEKLQIPNLHLTAHATTPFKRPR